MNPEQWQQCRNLFHAALELDPSKRAAFLAERVSDPGMRSEIEDLLSKHDSGGDFLEKPVFQEAPQLFDSEPGGSLIGQQLGPYKITGKLGEGGMGVVYLAENSRLRKLVALKTLSPDCMRDPLYRERLVREAQAAARLIHSGIATVHALEEFDGSLYIVYEYVRGDSLAEICRNAPLQLPLLLDLGIQITDALAFAHEKGIIHRDLKPQNIMRTDEGKIKILDFGLARIMSPYGSDDSAKRLTKTGKYIGTPAYSSPEQLLIAPVDFRTDIFSFGILLYEMASGVHPFAGSNRDSVIAQILQSEPPPLAQINPAVPTQFERIIQRCLRKDPNRRYGSARELLVDLENLALTVSRPSPRPDPVHIRLSPSRARWWWQFHQAFVGCLYYLMLYPLWRAKEWTPGYFGALFFYPTLVAVGVAANLRFHLWFTSASYPEELDYQRRRVHPWIRAADILFVSLLFLGAYAIYGSHAVVTTIIVTGAIGFLMAFTLIEPTTARASFKPDTTREESAKSRRAAS